MKLFCIEEIVLNDATHANLFLKEERLFKLRHSILYIIEENTIKLHNLSQPSAGQIRRLLNEVIEQKPTYTNLQSGKKT